MKKKLILTTGALMLLSVSAFAQEAGAAAPAGGEVRWNLIAAAFLLGIAAAAGAMGQARAISAACEGVARNPTAGDKIQLVMIIGLALIESLVIYALVIAYFLMNK